MEETDFKGSLVIWFFGLIFIFVIHFTSEDKTRSLLIIHTEQIENPIEMIKQIIYVLYLSDMKGLNTLKIFIIFFL